ncbi:hypothetical protein [uncultured Clostridium sp.]|uniref:hypothetical protein n=1 Tax=uncultured Clostridium sp. TaxID=59620 RepID=UPI0028EF287A|nr:hypothetical protein [uncultured Clostridium sp.]
MKYKGIELREGKDSEAELLCSVSFVNKEPNYKIVEDMEDKLISLFEDYQNEIEIETVSDELILVRCWDISFDEKGVQILKSIYDKLLEAKLNAEITVSVHIDGEIWFKDENGHEYNEDDVNYEEFLKYVEY